MDVGRYPKSLIDASGYLILVKFSGIVRLVDISRNFRLSGFPKFQFKVRAVYYKAFLPVIGGSK